MLSSNTGWGGVPDFGDAVGDLTLFLKLSLEFTAIAASRKNEELVACSAAFLKL